MLVSPPSIERSDPAVPAGFRAVLDGEVLVDTSDFCIVKVDSIFLGAVRVEGYQPPTWPATKRSRQVFLDLSVNDVDGAESRLCSWARPKKHGNRP